MNIHQLSDWIEIESVYRGEAEFLLKLRDVIEALRIEHGHTLTITKNDLMKTELRIREKSKFIAFIRICLKKNILSLEELK